MEAGEEAAARKLKEANQAEAKQNEKKVRQLWKHVKRDLDGASESVNWMLINVLVADSAGVWDVLGKSEV